MNFFRKNIVLSIIILGSLASSMVNAAPSSTSAINAFERDAKAYAATYDVSQQEALRRLMIQNASSVELDRLKNRFASRLAGVYIEHNPTYRVVFYLTGNVPVSDFTLNIKNPSSKVYGGSLKLPVHIRTGAKYTKLELINTLNLYSKDIAAQFPNGQGIAVDEENNVLDVTVYDLNYSPSGRSTMLPSQLSPRLQKLPIQVSYTDIQSRPAAAVRASESMLMYKPSSLNVGYNCTSGFNVQDKAGKSYSTTAAHCGNNKITVKDRKANTSVQLNFFKEYHNGSQDFQLMTVADKTTTITPSFFAGDNVVKTLTGRRTRTSTNTNDYVCHTGQTTGYSCGTVDSTNFKILGGKNKCGPNQNLTCNSTWVKVSGENLDCWGGDSGGPVYIGNTAVGLLSTATYEGKWSASKKGKGFCGGQGSKNGFMSYMSTDEIYKTGYSLVYGK